MKVEKGKLRILALQFLSRISEQSSSTDKGSSSPLDLTGMMNVAVVNTLWRIVTGEVLDQRDPKIVAITDAFTR